MESRIYTAQEMSDVSQRMKESGFDGEIILTVKQSDGSYKEYHGDDIIEMLRQAAEMRGRAYAVIAKAKKANETQTSFGCRTCVENYIKEINYILSGDTGKELK